MLDNTRTLQSKYTTLISTAVYKDNVNDVPRIAAIAEELGIPLRVTLVMPVGKGEDVQLLTPLEISQLRGYLLAQRVQKGDTVESPLLHQNNCTALTRFYGMAKKGLCPLDCGKQYLSPRGKASGCEFVPQEEKQ